MKNHVLTGVSLLSLVALFTVSGCSDLPTENNDFLSDEVVPVENAIIKDDVVEPEGVVNSEDLEVVELNGLNEVNVPEDLPYPETAERINISGDGINYIVSFYVSGGENDDFCSAQSALLAEKGWVEVSREDEKKIIMFEKEQSALTLKCMMEEESGLITLVKTNISNNEEESGQ